MTSAVLRVVRSGGRQTAHRPRLVSAGIALVVVVGLAACAPSGPDEEVSMDAPSSLTSPSPQPHPTVSPAPAEPVAEGTEPQRVAVPAIGVDGPLVPLGLDDEGQMEVPADYGDIGWLTSGGRPGGRGPTVIAAHVSSGTAPAVFARLSEVAVGDLVEVTDIRGKTAHYRVTEVADYAKDRFPTARVFGATADDELRLITCAGLDTVLSEYVENRVVFAVRES